MQLPPAGFLTEMLKVVIGAKTDSLPDGVGRAGYLHVKLYSRHF